MSVRVTGVQRVVSDQSSYRDIHSQGNNRHRTDINSRSLQDVEHNSHSPGTNSHSTGTNSRITGTNTCEEANTHTEANSGIVASGEVNIHSPDTLIGFIHSQNTRRRAVSRENTRTRAIHTEHTGIIHSADPRSGHSHKEIIESDMGGVLSALNTALFGTSRAGADIEAGVLSQRIECGHQEALPDNEGAGLSESEEEGWGDSEGTALSDSEEEEELGDSEEELGDSEEEYYTDPDAENDQDEDSEEGMAGL